MPGDTTSSFYATSPTVGTNYPNPNDTNTEPVTGNTAAPSSFYQDGGGNYAEANPDEALTYVNEAEASAAAAASSETAAANSAANSASSATTATNEAAVATIQATSASNNAGVAFTNAQSALASSTNAANSATAAANSSTTATNEANTATTEAGTATTQAGNAAASASSAAASAVTASGYVSQKGAANGIATLDGGGHLTATQIPTSLVGALQYQGAWNASTNSPTITSGTGTTGQFYKVSVAGATTIDGNSQWNIGDQIVFDGTTWDKIDGISSEVVSVAGRFGAVVLSVSDVSGAAPTASPALTGAPTAPTPTTGDNSTKIATTAFVQASTAAAGVSSIGGKTGVVTVSHGLQMVSNDLEIIAGQIPGVATNTVAAAGSVGEVIVSSGTSGSLTSGTPIAATSIPLTPGDWDISALVQFGTSGGTSVTDWYTCVSTTSSSMAAPYSNTAVLHNRVPATADYSLSHVIPPTQALIAANTTFYLNVEGVFTGTAPAAVYTLRARRMR